MRHPMPRTARAVLFALLAGAVLAPATNTVVNAQAVPLAAGAPFSTPEPVVGDGLTSLPVEPAVVDLGPVDPVASLVTGDIEMWSDRGCGPGTVFANGEIAYFYFRSQNSGSADIYYHTPVGSQRKWTGNLTGGNRYQYGPVLFDGSQGGGKRFYRVIMTEDHAQNICTFTVQGSGSVLCAWVDSISGPCAEEYDNQMFVSCSDAREYLIDRQRTAQFFGIISDLHFYAFWNPQASWSATCERYLVSRWSRQEYLGSFSDGFDCERCPSGTAATGTINIWTNKGAHYGCDGTYYRGDPITVNIRAGQSGTASFFNYWADGQVKSQELGTLQAGVTYQSNLTVTAPEGRHVMRVIMPGALALDTCSYVVSPKPPTPAPPPPPSPPPPDTPTPPPPRGSLEGVVRGGTSTGDDGDTIATASVALVDPATGAVVKSTYSATDGAYRLDALREGTYRLVVEKNGMMPFRREIVLAPAVNVRDVVLCGAGTWYAEYHDNRSLSGEPVVERCDADVDFFWADRSPEIRKNPAGGTIPADNFSVRWTSVINLPRAGYYRFRVFSDDGARLYLDGEGVIDDFSPRAFAERSYKTTDLLAAGNHDVVVEFVEWARDSLIHLAWYQCAGNAGEGCTTVIPALYQTQYLDTPLPARCNSQSVYGGQTIAGYGCAMTSLAMAFDRFDVKTAPPDFNDWLSAEYTYFDSKLDKSVTRPMRGFAGKDVCSGYLLWDAAVEYLDLPKGAHRGVWQVNVSGEGYDVVQNLGRPVLLKRAWICGDKTCTHYVLATDVALDGVGNRTFGINDPLHMYSCTAEDAGPTPPKSRLRCTVPPKDQAHVPVKHATTAGELADYVKGQTSVFGYIEPNAARSASLQISSTDTEMLLEGADGRRLGYDSSSGRVVNDYGNAAYIEGDIAPPEAMTSARLRRTLFLPEGAGGDYTLKVSSRRSSLMSAVGVDQAGMSDSVGTPFTVDLNGFDAEFVQSAGEIEGRLAPGRVAEFELHYAPGAAEIDTRPAKTLYLPALRRL